MAKAALDTGRLEMARYAAEQGFARTQDGSGEQMRMRVYLAASLVTGDDFEKGMGLLDEADHAKLSVEDLSLLESAKAVAAQVRSPVGSAGALTEMPAAAEGGSESLHPPALQRARDAIAQVDQLLTGSKQWHLPLLFNRQTRSSAQLPDDPTRWAVKPARPRSSSQACSPSSVPAWRKALPTAMGPQARCRRRMVIP
jgi:hypothetical protein